MSTFEANWIKMMFWTCYKCSAQFCTLIEYDIHTREEHGFSIIKEQNAALQEFDDDSSET